MIYRLIIVLIIGFFTINSYAQNIYVTDSNGLPIPNVFVFNQNIQELTNEEGLVVIPVVEHVEISFQHIGYGTITYSFVQIQSMGYKIALENKCTLLDEVELIGRNCKQKKEIFQQLESIKISDLVINQAQSTPELLEAHSGVFVQKSQMGGGSPVVRGFEANKVLLVQDGVRLNNAIFRSGHLHNILSIDDQAIEKIDVIFGPGALNYGSDAIGGVLHFVSKEPKFNKRSLKYHTSYSTTSKGVKSYIDFNLSNKKIASITSLSYGNFGELKTGEIRTDNYPDFGKRKEYISTENGIDKTIQNEDPNIQVGTAYQQWNISNKTRYIVNDHLSLSSNTQYSSSSDIPRYDFLNEYKGDYLKYAEWKYGPQKRLFAAGTLDWYKKSKLFDQFKTIISFQQLQEERIKRKNKDLIRHHNKEQIDVYGFTMDFIKNTKYNNKLTYGIDLQYNDLNSSAYSSNIETGLVGNDILTRYPNGENSMTSSGIYISYFMQDIWKNFHSNIGVRFQHTDVKIQYVRDGIVSWPDANYIGLNNQNNATTGSIAMKWEPIPAISLNWMSATAFRAPNIDDIAKVRVKKGAILTPNVNLEPEKSLSHELSVTWRPLQNKESYINASIYQTRLKDAIVRQDYLFNGSSIYINNLDTLNVISNINAANALVRGISISSKVDINKVLSLKASITKILGNQTVISSSGKLIYTPLAHIPPAYGSISLDYNKNKLSAQITYKYYDEKKVEEYGDSSDNLENATVDGTPEYHLFHIGTSYKINDRLHINLGVQNIFDRHYRMFSSGVSGAGRNIIMSIKGTI